ncbi:MAG: NAD-dependent DNA ligase LigA [Methylacidiphilales bacterium]|nr:NAD-dependent DNA ligase LigA [Candidatus Methylacidiphilales bacterium]
MKAIPKPDELKHYHRLVEEVRSHDIAYYTLASPRISDFEYDGLYRELKDFEGKYPEAALPDSPTQKVGGKPLEEFKQVRHQRRMQSLDNTYSTDEVRAFITRIEKSLPGEEISFVVEPKIDGVAVTLRYEEGAFVQGATRGDGETGDDITDNLRTLRQIPIHISGKAKVLEVRGEVFMTHAAFARMNEARTVAGQALFANARNAAAGTLKMLDSREVAKRPLSIVLYGTGELNGVELASQAEALKFLKSMGFPTPEWHAVCKSGREVLDAVTKIDELRKNFAYPTDGAVIKVNEFALRDKLEKSSERILKKSPPWAVAYKFAPDQAETALKAITIQVGRTGVLTPVAELEPVLLAGSTISRATLHNEDEIKAKDIRVGDTVVIEKAGEVIPAVIRVVTGKRPKETKPFDLSAFLGGKCPVCGGPIRRDEQFVAWRCENLDCSAQKTRRLEHFAQRAALDIENLGGAVADKLVESGWVSEPWDLYGLNIDKLSGLNLGTAQEPRVFGSKNARKLIDALEASKHKPLSKWIFALAIPEIGDATARELARFHKSVSELASSELLRKTCKLDELREEAKRTNPRGRNSQQQLALTDKPARDGQHELVVSQIQQLESELLESGFGKKGGQEKILTVIGPVAAKSLLDFFDSERGRLALSEMKRLHITPSLPSGPAHGGGGALDGKVFVITGTLSKPREVFAAKIGESGGKVTGAVTKNTDYLLCGSDAGSKLEKAKEIGLRILTEEEFHKLIGDVS